MTTTVTTPKTTTCRLVIVDPGKSDAVIKITPATHATEKIWLDNQPGRERWDAVKRMMNNYGPKFGKIPSPAYMCSDATDLKTPDLKEEDIPVVTLQEYVFEPLPASETEDVPMAVESDRRIENLEASVGTLTKLMTKLVDKLDIDAAAGELEGGAKRTRK